MKKETGRSHNKSGMMLNMKRIFHYLLKIWEKTVWWIALEMIQIMLWSQKINLVEYHK